MRALTPLSRDYAIRASVRRLFEQTGTVDALIAVVGGDSVYKGYGDIFIGYRLIPRSPATNSMPAPGRTALLAGYSPT
jgi:hypothetical protein